jgi:hypothetical protein
MSKKKRKIGDKDQGKEKNKPEVPDGDTLPSLREKWHAHAVIKNGSANSCRYCGDQYNTPRATMAHADAEHISVFIEEYRDM